MYEEACFSQRNVKEQAKMGFPQQPWPFWFGLVWFDFMVYQPL